MIDKGTIKKLKISGIVALIISTFLGTFLWVNIGSASFAVFLFPFIFFYIFLIAIADKYSKKRKEEEELEKFYIYRRRFFPVLAHLAIISDTTDKEMRNFLLKNYRKDLIDKNIAYLNKCISNERESKKTNYSEFIKHMVHNSIAGEKVKYVYKIVEFAVLDKKYTLKEDEFIKEITKKIKFPNSTTEKIRAMFNILIDETRKTYSYSYNFLNSKNKVSKKTIYCKILGINSDVTENEIRKKYYELAKIYHPDKLYGKNKKEIEKNTEMFQRISEAYEYLIKLKKS